MGELCNYEDVLTAANNAIELNPKSINAWRIKYLMSQKLGRFVEASEASNKITEIMRTNAE